MYGCFVPSALQSANHLLLQLELQTQDKTVRPRAGQNSPVSAFSTPESGRRSSRYALRQRPQESAKAMLGAKRNRGEEEGGTVAIPRPKRRMKSSVTKGVINVEELMTPSPMNRTDTTEE